MLGSPGTSSHQLLVANVSISFSFRHEDLIQKCTPQLGLLSSALRGSLPCRGSPCSMLYDFSNPFYPSILRIDFLANVQAELRGQPNKYEIITVHLWFFLYTVQYVCLTFRLSCGAPGSPARQPSAPACGWAAPYPVFFNSSLTTRRTIASNGSFRCLICSFNALFIMV